MRRETLVTMSLLSTVEMAPKDPIFGLSEQFGLSTVPNKVNLCVGVYLDETGKLPLLNCVQAAEKLVLNESKARGYLPMDGLASYDAAVKGLVFGADSAVVSEGRVATVQAIGGTGGLKVGADFLYRMNAAGAASSGGQPKVLISDPSWENHRALFTNAGFVVETYPYYEAGRRGINAEAMFGALETTEAGTIVVLHACCHNPTGCELNADQWARVVDIVKSRGLVPFLDMAYQGFGEGIVEDGAVVNMFVAAGLDFLVSTSFSKSFALYGERVGALSVVCSSAGDASKVLSQLKIAIRTNYSNPPTHGASVVATVLNTPELRSMWEAELGNMRVRIKAMRLALANGLVAAGVTDDVSYITEQSGMFSYSGLSESQMKRLRDEFGVFGLDSGRICVAALNDGNIAHVCASIAAVM